MSRVILFFVLTLSSCRVSVTEQTPLLVVSEVEIINQLLGPVQISVRPEFNSITIISSIPTSSTDTIIFVSENYLGYSRSTTYVDKNKKTWMLDGVPVSQSILDDYIDEVRVNWKEVPKYSADSVYVLLAVVAKDSAVNFYQSDEASLTAFDL